MKDTEIQEVKIIQELIRPPFALLMGDDDIVRVYTSDSAWITIAEARKLVSALGEITGGVPHLVIKIPGRHTANDKESRTFIASEEGMQYSIAEAIVTSNMGHRVMGKLLMGIDKPPKPIKLFRNDTDAITWLKNLKS